jgi:hypothetical protein
MPELNPGGAASMNEAIKLRYEANANTNAFTDAEKTKLGGIASGAQVNPSIITAAPSSDQTDWNPSGFGSGVGTIKLQPTTNAFISGLAAGATDQEVRLINDSNFLVCLTREDAASTAANRFNQNSVPSVWLLPQEAVSLRYSATLSRWAIIGMSRDVFVPAPRTQMFLPSTTTSLVQLGIGASTTTATVSTANPVGTPSNEFFEYASAQVTNSTAAGTSSVRASQLQFMRGASAGRQGFLHAGMVRFTAMGATGAVRAGLMNSTNVSTTLNAATTQCLMIGAQEANTNLRIYMGGASAGTPVDLGANFPAPGTAAYEYAFLALPNSSDVQYMVRRLDTRFVAQGTLTTNVPGNTTALAPTRRPWLTC